MQNGFDPSSPLAGVVVAEASSSPSSLAQGQASAQPERLPPGVWRTGKRICAGIKVRSRKAYLGRFPDVASAAAAVAYAVRLRDARKAAGQPVTRGELRGGLAVVGEVDLLSVRGKAPRAKRDAAVVAGAVGKIAATTPSPTPAPPATATAIVPTSQDVPQADAA